MNTRIRNSKLFVGHLLAAIEPTVFFYRNFVQVNAYARLHKAGLTYWWVVTRSLPAYPSAQLVWANVMVKYGMVLKSSFTVLMFNVHQQNIKHISHIPQSKNLCYTCRILHEIWARDSNQTKPELVLGRSYSISDMSNEL